MKKPSILVLAALWAGLVFTPAPALAQAVTPPAPTSTAAAGAGQVTGKVIDKNQGMPVVESQQVMLHIWDQQNNDINMLHAQSTADGSFLFTGVDLQARYLYGTMVVYEGVTYVSEIIPLQEGSNQLELDIPVYETTQDAASVQVDQMHVLFDFAPDGLQTTEIYALSNTGTRTVKGAVRLADGKTATMRYPLPKDADYIFFQPDTTDRFVKFAGGFADTSPLLPGGNGDRFGVQYMVPYTGEASFDYTAPADIKALNFLLPVKSGVQLRGEGLAGPQPVTLESGKSYEVYSLTGIRVGQTFHVTLSGKPAAGGNQAAARTRDLSLPLGLGGGLLGLAMIGAGIWWWRRPEPEDAEEEEGSGADPGDSTLDDLVARIAQLDHAHEQGEVDEEQYRQERARLRDEAKAKLRDPHEP